MPKRSNSFQRVMTALYDALAPQGATVEESAMVPEQISGTDREVDVLITVPALGTQLRVAIECRDHIRPQSVEWVDALIGKYSGLPIDKVIAVSDSGFTPAAEAKAEGSRLELVTASKIEEVDWAARLGQTEWKSLHVKHAVMLVAGMAADGTEVTLSRMEAWGARWDSKDENSEMLLLTYLAWFMEHHAERTKSELEAKHIAPKWDSFTDGELRWCEIVAENDFKIAGPSGTIELAKIIVGVGTRFTWETMTGFHRVVGDFAVSELTESGTAMTIVEKKGSGVVRVSVRI